MNVIQDVEPFQLNVLQTCRWKFSQPHDGLAVSTILLSTWLKVGEEEEEDYTTRIKSNDIYRPYGWPVMMRHGGGGFPPAKPQPHCLTATVNNIALIQNQRLIVEQGLKSACGRWYRNKGYGDCYRDSLCWSLVWNNRRCRWLNLCWIFMF